MWENHFPGLPEKMLEIRRRLEEEGIDYSRMGLVVIGGKQFQGGLLGMEKDLIGFKEGNRVVWIQGMIIDIFDQPNGGRNQMSFVALFPLPFNDQIIKFSLFNDSHGKTIVRGGVIENDWLYNKGKSFFPDDLNSLWQESGGDLTVVFGGSFWKNSDWKKCEGVWEKGDGSFELRLQYLDVNNSR